MTTYLPQITQSFSQLSLVARNNNDQPRNNFEAPYSNSSTWVGICETRDKANVLGENAQAYQEAAEAELYTGNQRRSRSLARKADVLRHYQNRLNSAAKHEIVRSNSRRRRDVSLDLHGLYVKEAKGEVDNALANAEANGRSKIIIDPGRGKRSRGKSRLRPAIAKHLRQNGYQFDNSKGKYVVYL